ncbi:MAG TPA: zinc ribbon domain-containing protein [Gaiellaceae bacterium]|nr:zinc ribbon domain-containing protein [Gaiellaceae bacterium]
MPIYEYRCPNGHVFEIFQRMDDPPPEKCEVCGASPLQRVLYPVAVHFKGSGFYSTDYGRSRKRGGGKESSDGGGSDGGGEKKSSESKSEKTSSSD